jgi:glycosyltransferase involved in cell wall biosynthesis
MTRARRVLMVAYFYPPIGGAGVQRSAKFAKYLPDFGWEPYIISTTESVGGEELDPTLMADVRPGTPVWRIPTPRAFPLQAIYRGFPGLEQHALHGNRLSRILLKAALFVPSIIESPPADPFFWWSLRIIPLALRVIAQHKIDVIYTTSSPWSSTIAGRVLKRLTGKPWVADFRDPWTQNPVFFFYSDGWRRRWDESLEQAALATADQVVTVMPMQDSLRWESSAREKERVIYNGYDRADFACDRPELSDENASFKPVVSIVHMGSLYPGKHKVFFDILGQLQSSTQQTAELRITFVGDSGYAQAALDGRSTPGACVGFVPRVSHAEAVRLLRSADILLLMLSPTFVSGKVFEYLVSGTPILAIVAPDSAVADIVRSTGTGCVVDPEDTEGLRRVLQQLTEDYEGFRTTHFRPDPASIEKYERRELTGQLAGVLDEMVTAR